MALLRDQLLDLVMEERQIQAKLEKIQAQCDARRVAAQRALADELNAIAAEYNTLAAAAQSRLVEIEATLKAQGAWGE